MPSLSSSAIDAKKIGHATGVALAAGKTVSIGFLSAFGAIALGVSAPIVGLLTFFSMAEAQVCWVNINDAFKRLLTKDYLAQQLIDNALIAHIQQLPDNKAIESIENEFIREYCLNKCEIFDQKAKLDEAKYTLDHYDEFRADNWFLLPKSKIKEEIKKLSDELKELEDDLISKQNVVINILRTGEDTAELKGLIKLDDLKQDIRQRLAATRVFGIFSLLSGVAYTIGSFAGASTTLQSAILALNLGLTVGSLTMPLIALSIIGGIACAFSIYRTFSELCEHVKLAEIWQKLKAEDNKLVKVVGIIVGVLTIALCITSTIATAGAWWELVKLGINIFGPQSSFWEMAQNILVPIYVATSLCFDLKNSLIFISGAAAQFKNYLQTQHDNFQTKWQNYQAEFSAELTKHGLGYVLNPFSMLVSLVAKIFPPTLLLGHCVAEACQVDRNEFFSAAATVGIVTANTMVVDADYIVHAELESANDEEISSNETIKDIRHKLDHAPDEHSHGILRVLEIMVGYVALAPVHLMSAIWEVSLTKMANCLRSTPATETRSFCTVLKSSFAKFSPHHHHEGFAFTPRSQSSGTSYPSLPGNDAEGARGSQAVLPAPDPAVSAAGRSSRRQSRRNTV